MAPTPRAQKKRKTDTSTTAVSVTKPISPAAAAAKPKPADEDKDTEAGGVALPTPDDDGDDDDDKYASAESSDEESVDEYSLASESSADDSDDSISSLVAAQNQQNKKKRKRNNAKAFSTSMSRILSSHLTTTARKDPVLVRAKQNTDHVDDGKLEAKARRILKEEMRKEKEKGRNRDLVPKDDDVAAGKALEKERALKGIARSGVARLYNAVRAAQIKGEEAAKGVKKEGVVGMSNREAKGTFMFWRGTGDQLLTWCTAASDGDVETGFSGPYPVCKIERVMSTLSVFLLCTIKSS
jgi:hypothetical protein